MTTQTTAPMILNLTEYPATPEQIAAGVVDLTGAELVELREALTFEVLTTSGDIMRRAWRIARLAHRSGAETVMVGGEPYLMRALEDNLCVHGIKPVYAFPPLQSRNGPDRNTKEEHIMIKNTQSGSAPMIINLTQHPATPEQLEAGVVDLTGADLVELRAALTFDVLPNFEEINRRVWRIARLAYRHGAEAAMIGGAPCLMRPLEGILYVRRVKPLYAFTVHGKHVMHPPLQSRSGFN